jgi:hypothetical protein
MVNISEDNVTITMTFDQQDAIIVQAMKRIYRDTQNTIAKLESNSNLKEYQMDDLIYDQKLQAACEVLLRYHLTDHDYKKEMENE